MKIVWRSAAERDLEYASDYIAARNPDAALRVEHRLRTVIEHLHLFPRSGRIGRLLGTREVVLTEYPYVIRYRLAGDHVQILRIFHTSTQWTAS